MVISAHKRDKNDIYFIFTQETIHPRCPPRCPLLVHHRCPQTILIQEEKKEEIFIVMTPANHLD